MMRNRISGHFGSLMRRLMESVTDSATSVKCSTPGHDHQIKREFAWADGAKYYCTPEAAQDANDRRQW